ncbi:hypothetical protein NDU88_008631 [Pleurodeles waltl]|uniref:Uncharacterized protein n=1 Tax=Pleurodeles waltl TaxID=8319 RepID=A0AAV7QPA6_PLEWA|nr:hypothetical protein NDU88_008631 [Pleurodeles waltl]
MVAVCLFSSGRRSEVASPKMTSARCERPAAATYAAAMGMRFMEETEEEEGERGDSGPGSSALCLGILHEKYGWGNEWHGGHRVGINFERNDED